MDIIAQDDKTKLLKTAFLQYCRYKINLMKSILILEGVVCLYKISGVKTII